MAVKRSISTRLVMEGEKEYRASIKQINQEYRTLQSELKLVESSYKGQQNTIAALEAKHKTLNDLISKQAEKLNAEKTALDQVKSLQEKYADAAQKAREKLEALASGTDKATKETEEYKAEVAAIEKEILKYEAAEKNAADKVELHTRKMNEAEVGLNDLNGKLQQNEKHLDEAKSSTDGCAKSIDEYGKEVKEATEETEELGKKGKAGVDALASALAAAGVAATLKQIGEALLDTVKASIEFESAFAGVKKTVDATDEEYAKLSGSIKEMSTHIPSTTTELANIMELAGQLGVRGSDNLTKFTETIAALDVATNLTREDAATMLAQFANITGMPIENIDRLGSVIVDLGNNFATTEKDIVNMATNLASAFTQMGMTDAEIMAFATGLSSVGIEAQAGGTAFSKLGSKMLLAAENGAKGKEVIDKTGHSLRELEMLADQDAKAFKGLAAEMGLTSTELKDFMSAAGDMEQFAGVMGMTGEQFAAAFGEDAAGAIMTFLGGLRQIEEDGGSMIVKLEEMGLTEVRLSNAIRSAANSNELFARAQSTANRAWDENIALQNEAAQRYATTESKIAIFKNGVNNLKIAIGDQLTPVIRQWVETGTDVVAWAENLVQTNPELVHLITALLSVAGAFVGVATAIAIVMKAWQALTPMLAGNSWALAIAGVAAVATAIISIASAAKDSDEELLALQQTAENVAEKVKEATEGFEADTSNIDAAVTAAQTYITRLEELESQSSMTEKEQREYALTLEKLRTAMPGLNLEIDEQTGLLKDGAAAVRLQVEAWKEAQHAEAVIKARTTLVEAQVEAEMALYKALTKQEEKERELADWENRRSAALKELGTMAGLTAEEMVKLTDDELWDIVNTGKLTEVSEAYLKTINYIDDAAGSIEKTKGEIEDYNDVIDETQGLLDTASAAVQGFDDKMLGVADSTDEATEATNAYSEANKKLTGDAEAITAELDALIEAYQESYNAAYENLTSTMGLFTEMSTETGKTIGDMISALDSQLAYMDEYAAYIEKATALGIDEGLLAKLMDGSTESFAILKALTEGSEEELNAFKEKFEKAKEAKETLATNMADAKTAVSEEFNQMKDSVDDLMAHLNQEGLAYSNTAATMQGVVNAMENAKSQVGSIAAQINSMIAEIGQKMANLEAKQAKFAQNATPHAAGLDRVPYNEYPALLHKDEMVLTALQAKAYRAERFMNYGIPAKFGDSISNNNTQMGGITVVVQGGQGGEMAGRQAARALQRKLRYKGVFTGA